MGEVAGEHRVKRVRRPARLSVGARQFLVWLPGSFRVLGFAALRGVPVRLSLPGVGMLQCRVAEATVVLPRREKTPSTMMSATQFQKSQFTLLELSRR